MIRSSFWFSIALSLLALVGCGTAPANPTPIYTTVATPAVTAAADGVVSPLPAVEGEVILTISGKISATNTADNTAQFSITMLEQLGVVSYSVDDPQASAERQTFSGVLVGTLLAAVGADANATALFITAVDDYDVRIPIEDIRQYPVLLATRDNDGLLTIDRWGPTRIVYPYGYFDLDSKYDSRWIWDIATIVVE
jgi:hypothetical protein